MKFKFKNLKISYWFLFIKIFVLVLIAIATFSFKVDKSVILSKSECSYDNGWKVSGTNEELVGSGIHISNDSKELNVINTLPDEIDNGTVLCFRTYNQNVRVYIGNRLTYSFGENDSRIFSKTPGTAWHIINLSDSMEGESIEIQYTSALKPNNGTFGECYLGNTRNVLWKVIISNFWAIIMSIIIMVFAVAVWVYSFLITKLQKDGRGMFYLGIFTSMIAIWSFLRTGVVQVFYTNTSVIDFIANCCILCSVLPFLMYIFRVFFRKRQTLCSVVALLVAVFEIAMLLHFTLGLIDLYIGIIVLIAIQLVVMGVFLIIGVYDLIKSHSYRLIFFILSTIALISVEILDWRKYLFGIPCDYAVHVRPAVLIYLVIVTIYSYKRYMIYSGRYIERVALEKLAYEDILTKCKNRVYFTNEMHDTEENLAEYQNVAIVMFDVNNLKTVNDMYGHSSGDNLIQHGAYAISHAFAAYGTCTRIGGDEFCIILKDVQKETIEQCISKMLEEVNNYNSNTPYLLEIAYGYEMFDSRLDRNLEDLMGRADKKMYECKKSMKEKPIIEPK